MFGENEKLFENAILFEDQAPKKKVTRVVEPRSDSDQYGPPLIFAVKSVDVATSSAPKVFTGFLTVGIGKKEMKYLIYLMEEDRIILNNKEEMNLNQLNLQTKVNLLQPGLLGPFASRSTKLILEPAKDPAPKPAEPAKPAEAPKADDAVATEGETPVSDIAQHADHTTYKGIVINQEFVIDQRDPLVKFIDQIHAVFSSGSFPQPNLQTYHCLGF